MCFAFYGTICLPGNSLTNNIDKMGQIGVSFGIFKITISVAKIKIVCMLF